MGPEELAKIHVVRRFLKPEATAVVEVHGKLSGETLKLFFFNRCTHFLGKHFFEVHGKLSQETLGDVFLRVLSFKFF